MRSFSHGNRRYAGFALLFSTVLLFYSVTANAELTHISCGGLGDRPCLVSDSGWWEGGLGVDGCDRGLDRNWIGTGACWRFWSCNYRYPWQCEADERVDAFVLKNHALTAYLQQIELGRHEPINWLNLIGTHNAYNNASDNYLVPNQTHSITEQLELGVRVLALDVHERDVPNPVDNEFGWVPTQKLSHAIDSGLGGSDLDRHLIYGLREIREWLKKNPAQFVILRFESYIDEDSEPFRKALAAELGPYLLRENEKPADRWPTLAEMRASGRRAIAISDGPINEYVHLGYCCDDEGKLQSYSSGRKAKAVKKALNENLELPLPSTQKFTHVEEDSLRKNPPVPGDTCFDYEYPDPEDIFGPNIEWTEGMGMICPMDEPCDKGPASERIFACPMDRIVTIEQVVDHGFSTIWFDQWFGSVYTSSGASVSDSWALSPMTWSLGRSYYSGEVSRDNGAASMNLESGWDNWHANSPENINHYACSYLREGEPSLWTDTIEGRGPNTSWRITTQEGPWAEGWQACAEEFGAEGFVFSVPTNSWQHKDLYRVLAASDADEVWLAYRDTDEEIGSVNWDLDRGFAGSGISASPTPAKEGEPIRFVSEIAAEDLLACQSFFETPGEIAAADFWDMGDGLAAGSSDEFEVTSDGLRLIKWYTYSDNFIPYVITHRLPTLCEVMERQHLQFVYNVAPELRPDCDVWDECPETVDRGEPMVRAGEPTEIRAAFFDAGAADVHAAHIEWGDGETSAGTVMYGPDLTEGISGTLSASHAYMSCGPFRIDLRLDDDDLGSGSEFQVVQVDEAPPAINCPDDVVAEAISPTTTPVMIGQPDVEGGICIPVNVTNNDPGRYPLGLTQVTWTVRNSDEILDPESEEYIQLEDSCEQTVSVVDTLPPVVTAPPAVRVKAYSFIPLADIGTATATDAVGVVSISHDAPRVFPEGPTKVTWSAIDEAGNIGSETQMVVGATSGGGLFGLVESLLLFLLASIRRWIAFGNEDARRRAGNDL